MPEELATVYHQDDKIIMQTGQPIIDAERSKKGPDGSERWRLVSKAPLRDTNGKVIGVIGIGRDITERKLAEQKIAELAAIVESSDDAIIGKTFDGIITSWNGGAERVYGYSAREAIGRSISFLVPPEHSDEIPTILESIKCGKSIEHFETKRIRKDGVQIDVSLTISPILDAANRVIGASSIAHDITARKQVDRLKCEFVSVASHELRTPLTSIRGSLGLIVGGVAGEVSPKAKSLVDIAYKNSERLVLLINDILDMEKIESGKMEFNNQPIELMPLLRQTVEANTGYADQYGVRLIFKDQLPGIQVNADSGRLTQVVTNLISNAVKYSPRGGAVEIAVRQRASNVRVSISDSGSGIPEQFQSRIFQKFAQADTSDTRQ